jgi:cytidylate kinase
MAPRERKPHVTEGKSDASKRRFVIAIDGPAGAGKSTVAAMLARRLGVPYLDTGAMYRTVGLLALRAGLTVPLAEGAADTVRQALADHTIDVEVGERGTTVLLDGDDVGPEIRTPDCSLMASAVSALSEVRRELVEIQRRLGERYGGVMEGRDIGTVVFPDARLKVFLTAVPKERALRRHRDLQQTEPHTGLEEVQRQQRQRDRQDSSREDSPLQVARGSVVVDTTRMAPEEVVERLVRELERSGDQNLDSSGRNTVRSRNDVS